MWHTTFCVINEIQFCKWFYNPLAAVGSTNLHMFIVLITTFVSDANVTKYLNEYATLKLFDVECKLAGTEKKSQPHYATDRTNAIQENISFVLAVDIDVTQDN